MTVDMCFEFCLSKGLDLSGVLLGIECRCGATVVNKAVWGDSERRESLQFATTSLETCEGNGSDVLKVHRYIGHFQSGGVPIAFVKSHAADGLYIRSVVAGRPVKEDQLVTGTQPNGSSPNGGSVGALGSTVSNGVVCVFHVGTAIFVALVFS